MSLRRVVEEVRNELGRARDAAQDRERIFQKELSLVHEVHRERARNLVHYWAFRDFERGRLHDQLMQLGLDSLGDIEWDVLSRIDRVLRRLDELSGGAVPDSASSGSDRRSVGREALATRTDALFGNPPHGRDARIMITLPAEGGDGPGIIQEFIAAGADFFRINCARDSRDVWHRLIDQIRQGRPREKCPLVFMDLGGSKLRVTSCAGGRRSIPLSVGDSLYISRTSLPSTMPEPDSEDTPARREIAVSNPFALAPVLPGHHVWFDDGKIGGIVRERGEDALRVEITYARKGQRKLRLERGLNLPDTPLRLPALTQKDIDDLSFAARQADFVALSFVRTAADVQEFRNAIGKVGGASPAIVIKIETREAFEHLPELMLAGMGNEKVTMLLARGDLAVECGILEIPRIQEEMLRYCAAAALPLFWCTGVLERMCRTGEPSRAEITDAVEAAGAQCVMLNKGGHDVRALRLLDELLTRRSGNR